MIHFEHSRLVFTSELGPKIENRWKFSVLLPTICIWINGNSILDAPTFRAKKYFLDSLYRAGKIVLRAALKKQAVTNETCIYDKNSCLHFVLLLVI